MMNFLKTLFTPITPNLKEGLYADQYSEDKEQLLIRTQYRQRWIDPDENPTPLTRPWLFDPCQPPKGWRYDPYYEIWVEINE